MASFVPPLAQFVVKLSKLVKEVTQLGCETFLCIVDVVAIRNWLNKVLDTLTDRELNDEMKLWVATRLIDKIAALGGIT